MLDEKAALHNGKHQKADEPGKVQLPGQIFVQVCNNMASSRKVCL